jgi:cytochrome c
MRFRGAQIWLAAALSLNNLTLTLANSFETDEPIIIQNTSKALPSQLDVKPEFNFSTIDNLFIGRLKNKSNERTILVAVRKLTLVSGESDYQNNCLFCHPRTPGNNNYGPSLFGVVGRTAGTAASFAFSPSYVEAGNKGLIWTQDNLFKFLADPVAFLSQEIGHTATSRMIRKFPDDALRKSIIGYLATLK